MSWAVVRPCASRVAINIGVDADEGELGDVDSGLLSDFAMAGGHDGFADFHETTWQCMFPRAGFIPTAMSNRRPNGSKTTQSVARAGVCGKVMFGP
jgi:hypothetical protein